MLTFIKMFAMIVQFVLSISTTLIFGAILVPLIWFFCKGISNFLFGPAWLWFAIIFITAFGSVIPKYEPQFRKLQEDYYKMKYGN